MDETSGEGSGGSGGITGQYRMTYPDAAGLVADIVIAVGEVTGRDSSALPPLGTVVDPDAFVSLFADSPEGREIEFTFEYAGCRHRHRRRRDPPRGAVRARTG